MSVAVKPVEFILGDAITTAPSSVLKAAKRSLLDLLGVAAAARVTKASRIAHRVAIDQWPAGAHGSTMVFDGRRAAPGGAAFAGAQTIDSLDAHDGYKPAKGHAGVAVLPSLLAVMEATGDTCSDEEMLRAFVIGYEIACRVAEVQHDSTRDYHASGSWNAVGAAAVAARLLGLNPRQTREALGIAEYFGPRSQMMRVIDHPTMLKDSSSWGAMTGVVSAYLAAHDYTGAPAITMEHDDTRETWATLGHRWLMTEQYLKLWPICRWAQPAVQAALDLQARHDVRPETIRGITIRTFREAKCLAGHAPRNTEQAQYSIAFPTACAIIHGRITVDEVAGSGLEDPAIRALAQRIEIVDEPDFSRAFPGRRFAQLSLVLADDRVLESDIAEAPGDPEMALSDEQVVDKFMTFAAPVIGDESAGAIREAIGDFAQPRFELDRLLEILRRPYPPLQGTNDAKPVR